MKHETKENIRYKLGKINDSNLKSLFIEFMDYIEILENKISILEKSKNTHSGNTVTNLTPEDRNIIDSFRRVGK